MSVSTSTVAVAQSVTVADVYAVLDTVNDPEMPMSVVDMGFIYEVRVDGDRVAIEMSLTSTGCPVHDDIVDEVREVISGMEGVSQADVQVVWDPPWTHARITPKGREALANWGIST